MTYEQVAARYGVPLCSGGCGASERLHRQGFTTLASGRLHWAPRKLTKRGLFNFLKLVADLTWGLNGRRMIERTWMRNTLAYEYAAELGYRFPRAWADTDRAKVRAYLGVATVDPETRKRILRWTRSE